MQLHGNRCGHKPASPTLEIARPILAGLGGHPRILAVAAERAETFYSEPEILPSLAVLNPTASQKRSERREGLIRLLKAVIKFLDLVSLTVAVRDAEGTLRNITVATLTYEPTAVPDAERFTLTSQVLAALQRLPPSSRDLITGHFLEQQTRPAASVQPAPPHGASAEAGRNSQAGDDPWASTHVQQRSPPRSRRNRRSVDHRARDPSHDRALLARRRSRETSSSQQHRPTDLGPGRGVGRGKRCGKPPGTRFARV